MAGVCLDGQWSVIVGHGLGEQLADARFKDAIYLRNLGEEGSFPVAIPSNRRILLKPNAGNGQRQQPGSSSGCHQMEALQRETRGE